MKVSSTPNLNYNVNCKDNSSKSQSVAFGSSGFNPVLMVMDGIDKGGFAASFIVQDMLGMAVPRTATGLTRNSDETGEKNTGYARLVAIREILSGPSTFIIPGVLIYGIKRIFGRANDVPINFIKGFSDHFEEFAEKNSNDLTNSKALKEAFYKDSVNNLVYNSTIGENNKHYLEGNELTKETEKLTKLLLEMENAPKKHFWNRGAANKDGVKYASTLKGEFIEHFVELRKSHSDNPSNKINTAWFKTKEDVLNIAENEKGFIKTKVGSFVDYLTNFTNDITDTVAKKFKSGENIKSFVQDFGHRRVASRFLTNLAMISSVIAFFTIIPKLYNSKDGKNPALAGLEADAQPSGQVKEGK